MEEVVLNRKPFTYPKQGLTHCGVFAAKAILSAYGRDQKNRPEDYHLSFLERFTGFALPSRLIGILGSRGVNAEAKSASAQKSKDRLNILKAELRAGRPVMVRIGNGYSRRTGKWSWLKYLVVGHWITVWGFDESKRLFYVYDPAVPDELDDKDVPIGNKRRSYGDMLRDWSWNGIQLLTLPKFLYIRIINIAN